jgi:hypothetical protein
MTQTMQRIRKPVGHEEEPDSTHPPLDKRLANLGFTEIPSIAAVENSAIDQLPSQAAVKDLPARFDNE